MKYFTIITIIILLINPHTSASENSSSDEYQGWIGISISEVNGKITVADILHQSPADKAGLQRNDILVSANGDKITNTSHITKLNKNIPEGEFVLFKVIRGEKIIDLKIYPTLKPDKSIKYPFKDNVVLLKKRDMETEWKKVASGKLYMLTKQEDYYLQLEIDGKIFDYIYEENNGMTFVISRDSIFETLFSEDVSNMKKEYGDNSYKLYPNSWFTKDGLIKESYGQLQIKIIPELQTNQETYDKYDDVDELLNNLQLFARINEREKFFSYCIVSNDDQDMEKFYSFMKDLANSKSSRATISRNDGKLNISYEADTGKKFDIELRKAEKIWCIYI